MVVNVDAKQKYIVDSVKLAVANLTDFLAEKEADFALRPDQLEALTFVFGKKDSEPRLDLEVRLNSSIAPDNYALGRIVGRAYHEAHNPEFKKAKNSPQKVHVERIIEHAFAMLYLRLNDETCDLDDAVNDYASAKDPPIKYTLLDEDVDPLDGKKGSSHVKRAIDMAKADERAERARKREDEQFKTSSYKEKDDAEKFEASPESSAYAKRELKGDDAVSGMLAKMKNEAFNTAKAIIEGRGEDNWMKTLGAALYKDVDDAKKYLSGVLGY